MISYIDGYPPVFSSQDNDRGIIVLKMVNEDMVYQVFETEDGGGSWNAAGKLSCESLGSYSLGGDGAFLFLDGEGNSFIASF